MDKKSRNKLIDDLKPKVLELSITEVVDSRLDGSRLSPFREDKHEGSFAVSEARGCCTDFVEGVTRNAIRFIMDYDGVNFQEAVLRISYEFGLIDEKTYKEVSEDPTKREVKKTTVNTKQRIKQSKKQTGFLINYVYLYMKNICGLSKEHKEYLLGRGIKEEDLDKYFSYSNKCLDKIIEEIKNNGRPESALLGIPGFYEEKGEIALRDLEGIAIPLINAEGDITAIQLRRDKVEEGQPRYLCLSSSGYYKGCTCGSQAHIERPWIDGDVYITEGQFKALEMSKYFNSTVVSVQGVNNIKCLEMEIPNLLKRQKINNFIIAFDADLMHNNAVIKAARKLAKLLSSYNIPVKYLTWDEKYGKGADDVIQSGNAKYFHYQEKLEN